MLFQGGERLILNIPENNGNDLPAQQNLNIDKVTVTYISDSSINDINNDSASKQSVFSLNDSNPFNNSSEILIEADDDVAVVTNPFINNKIKLICGAESRNRSSIVRI